MSYGCDYCLGDPEDGACPYCGLRYYEEEEEEVEDD